MSPLDLFATHLADMFIAAEEQIRAESGHQPVTDRIWMGNCVYILASEALYRDVEILKQWRRSGDFSILLTKLASG